MQNSNEVTQRCQQILVSPTSKYHFSGRHFKQYQTHGLQMWTCCQTSRQGCRGWDYCSDRNPTQHQVNMVSVHSSGSTNDWSLGFVRIQYNAPVTALLLNPSQVPVQGGSNNRSVYYCGEKLSHRKIDYNLLLAWRCTTTIMLPKSPNGKLTIEVYYNQL